MNKYLLLITFLLCGSNLIGQCLFEGDYGNTAAWSTVGTGVTIANGQVEFDNATGSQQRRVYQTLSSSFDSSDTWTVEFEFTPTAFGGSTNSPLTGASLFALTAGTKAPFSDCTPSESCSSFPSAVQDAAILTVLTPLSGNREVYFQMIIINDGAEVRSDSLVFINPNAPHYISFSRTGPSTYELRLFTNANRTNEVAGSPILFDTQGEVVTGLNTVQHGVITRGSPNRLLSGSIDNLCVSDLIIRQNVEAAPLPAIPRNAKLAFILFSLLMGSLMIRKLG